MTTFIFYCVMNILKTICQVTCVTITVSAVEKLEQGIVKKHVNPIFMEKKTIVFIAQMINCIFIKASHLIE